MIQRGNNEHQLRFHEKGFPGNFELFSSWHLHLKASDDETSTSETLCVSGTTTRSKQGGNYESIPRKENSVLNPLICGTIHLVALPVRPALGKAHILRANEE